MADNYLLYRASCGSCRRAADRVHDVAQARITPISLSSPHAGELLARAGVPQPTRPALIVVDETRVRVFVGVSLLWRVLKLLGARRTFALLSALNQSSHSAATSTSPSAKTLPRRTVLRWGAVVPVVGVLWPSLASGLRAAAATNSSGPNISTLNSLSPDDPLVIAMRANSPVIAQAVQVFGPIDWSQLVSSSFTDTVTGTHPFWLLPIAQNGASTSSTYLYVADPGKHCLSTSSSYEATATLERGSTGNCVLHPCGRSAVQRGIPKWQGPNDTDRVPWPPSDTGHEP